VKKTANVLRRILTDDSLRVKKSDESNEVRSNVFALGDAADIEENSLPTTAEVAVQKARFLVQHLNKTPKDAEVVLGKFEYKQKNLVTYIGSHDGIGQGWSADSPYSGYQAWLSWRAGSFTWSRTWRSWANVGWAMLVNLVFGRDPMSLL
jgi:NADH:ubiquinone reductase (non-electrogenic)